VAQQQFEPSIGGKRAGYHGTGDCTIEHFFLGHKASQEGQRLENMRGQWSSFNKCKKKARFQISSHLFQCSLHMLVCEHLKMGDASIHRSFKGAVSLMSM